MIDPQLRRAIFTNEIGHMLTYMAGLLGGLVIAIGPVFYADSVVNVSMPVGIMIGMASFLLAFVWFVMHAKMASVLFDGGI